MHLFFIPPSASHHAVRVTRVGDEPQTTTIRTPFHGPPLYQTKIFSSTHTASLSELVVSSETIHVSRYFNPPDENAIGAQRTTQPTLEEFKVVKLRNPANLRAK